MASWQNKLTPDEMSLEVDLIYTWPEVIQSGIVFPESKVVNIFSLPQAITAGARSFGTTWTSCHGTDGYGTRMAPALNNVIFLSEFPDAAIYQVIAGGVSDTLIPAWGSRLSDQDIQNLVVYLRSWQESAPEILHPVLEN